MLKRRKPQTEINTRYYALFTDGRSIKEVPVEGNLNDAMDQAEEDANGRAWGVYEMNEFGGSRRVVNKGL